MPHFFKMCDLLLNIAHKRLYLCKTASSIAFHIRLCRSVEGISELKRRPDSSIDCTSDTSNPRNAGCAPGALVLASSILRASSFKLYLLLSRRLGIGNRGIISLGYVTQM